MKKAFCLLRKKRFITIIKYLNNDITNKTSN